MSVNDESEPASRVALVRERVEAYCEDTTPAGCAARLALSVYLGYAGIRHLQDPFYDDAFGAITLVVHEAGHLVCRGFGRTIYILGGSMMQLFVPAFVAVYLLVRQRDWFGCAVGTAWLSFSGWNLATYIGDANKQQLPLAAISPGVPEHDWANLLTQWHLLNACDAIASNVRLVSFVVWAESMLLAGWLVVSMIRVHTKRLR
jgi:hypothetical protein